MLDEPSATVELRISLIIAAHNAAATLGAALWSVVAQSLQPFEVLVVDDGSTDNTVEIAHSFTDLLPIRVLSHTPNRGVGLTRRAGCEAATGDALTFLDSDDLLLPNHLAQLSAIYTGPGCIATGRFASWRPGREVELSQSDASIRVPDPDDQRIGILRGAFILITSLFSTADYRAVNGFRDLRVSEDWDLWIQLIYAGARVVEAPLATMLYRRRETSLTHSDVSATVQCDIEVLEYHLPRLTGCERRVGKKMLRRRRARALLIAGQQSAAIGNRFQARRQWLQAALVDRDLRNPRPGYDSSVAAAALIRIIRPSRDVAPVAAPEAVATGEEPIRAPRPTITVVVISGQSGDDGDDQGTRLRTTLAGIATQTVSPDEVIIVSETDTTSSLANTDAVIDAFSRHIPLRTVDCRDNAVTAGVEAAVGQAIAIVDAGDFWLPDHLEALNEVWDEETIAVARCLRWVPEPSRPELSPINSDDRSATGASLLELPIMISAASYSALGTDATIRQGCATAYRLTMLHRPQNRLVS